MGMTLEGFKKSLEGSAFQPDEVGYDITRWAKNSELPAQIVVVPSNARDIANAIQYARGAGLPIAVRSGGHHTSVANSTNGLQIDMRGMKRIRVDVENMVAYIEGGCQSHDIDVETSKYGVATTIGACSEVGIGGYATICGVGFSLGQYGPGVDNVLGATVVLANGEIVNADENENTDLYWGIRGGGPNFGVVAEFRMKLHKQRQDIYSINYVFSPAKLPTVVEAINDWLLRQKPTEGICFLISLGVDGNPYIILLGWSDSDQATGEASFKPLLDVGPAHVRAGQIPFPQFSTQADGFVSLKGYKNIVGAHFDKFDVETVQKSYDTWAEIVIKAPLSAVQYELFPFEKLVSKPVEATAFAQRYPFYTALCAVMYADESYAPQAPEDLLRLKTVVSSSSSKEAQESLGYVSYGDPWSTRTDTDEYARKMFGINYARLQQIKKKYDPENVWNRWFPIQPAN